jgi:hypothetical protein
MHQLPPADAERVLHRDGRWTSTQRWLMNCTPPPRCSIEHDLRHGLRELLEAGSVAFVRGAPGAAAAG